MEVTPPPSAATAGAARPVRRSPDSDRTGAKTNATSNGSPDSGNPNSHASHGQAIGAAAAAQQPKVVQTAFIHKLYKYVHAPRLFIWKGELFSFASHAERNFYLLIFSF